MHQLKSSITNQHAFKSKTEGEVTGHKNGEPVIKCLVNSHNEWDPLEEVIVGTAQGARVPMGDKGLFSIRYSDYDNAASIPSGPHDPRIIAEAEEDLNAIVDAFEALSIVVKRPKQFDLSAKFSTPDWESDGMYDYCPRDIFLPVGIRLSRPQCLSDHAFSKPLLTRTL